MKLLEDRILKDGIVASGDVLKVSSFVNHQIDTQLMCELGKEFHRLFEGSGINKILTIEASGIGIACITAQYFSVPVVFAKKSKTSNISDELYTTEVESFTHGCVSNIVVDKRFLTPEDKVLLIDDFLANGCALLGLKALCDAAGAEVLGAGIVIEKHYQGGGDKLRKKGIRVESLAKIESMENGKIVFCK